MHTLSVLLGFVCLGATAVSGASAAENEAPRAIAPMLAPTGILRAAINFGNPVLAQRDPANGEPRGVAVDLAQELARRLALPLQIVPFSGAGQVTDALKQCNYDICFLAIDPRRAEGIDFTAPYVVIEGGYLVPQGSSLQTIDTVDGQGVRVMADTGSAYALFLQRTLTRATLVYPLPGQRAGTYYLTNPVEALAGVRQPLAEIAQTNNALRLLPGRFMQIEQAMGIVRGREAARAYARAFIEEMKSSGFIAHSLAASGQAEAEVAAATP
jgi:polar amino acid transport system substrate-binding protein